MTIKELIVQLKQYDENSYILVLGLGPDELEQQIDMVSCDNPYSLSVPVVYILTKDTEL